MEPKVLFRSADDPKWTHTMSLRFQEIDVPIAKWMKLDPWPKYDSKNLYFRSLGAMYLATTKCGICTKDLGDTVVGGLLRYHIALTYMLMMENPNVLDLELDNTDRKIVMANIPTLNVITVDPGDNGKCDPWDNYRHYETDPNDYKKFIRRSSEGITEYGMGKITDSILTMIYCVLLAQGKTGFPIVSSGDIGMVQLTQTEFRRLHYIRVRSGDTSQTVRDTRAAMELILHKTTDWIDVAKGIIRVPATLLLYKLTENGNSLETSPLVDEPTVENVPDVDMTDTKGTKGTKDPEKTQKDLEEDKEDQEDDESEDSEDSEDEDSEDYEDDLWSNKYILPTVLTLGLATVGAVKLINARKARST